LTYITVTYGYVVFVLITMHLKKNAKIANDNIKYRKYTIIQVQFLN